MTNSTSTNVTFGGAWCNRVAAKQDVSHSTAPADEHINKRKYIQPPPRIIVRRWLQIYHTPIANKGREKRVKA